MPDREKVIKDIKECLSASCRGFRPRISCPYNDDEWDIMRDALSLLKEQEAVEPILIREGRNKNYNDYVCPRCDNEVVYEQNYCSECGVPFSWKGR